MKGLFIFITLLVTILADIKVTAPEAGKTYSGSSKIKIEWAITDDDGDFAIKNAKSFVISLCSGIASELDCYKALKTWKDLDKDFDTTSYEAEIDSDSCADGFYFFQLYLNYGDQKSTIHYTNRFELKDMDGSNGLDAPITVSTGQVAGATQDGAPKTIDPASYSLTYTAQTGLTRFAPMQMQPGTKVTATEWKRNFPTSAVTYYSTIRSKPDHISTTTTLYTYTLTSVPNYASAAPTPSVKYNPKQKVSAASLSSATKKRRWLD